MKTMANNIQYEEAVREISERIEKLEKENNGK